jgi:MoaE-MoaD fusion protein
MIKITVLFFASLKDRAKAARAEFDLADGACVRDLKAQVGLTYPALKAVIQNSVVSINKEFAFDTDPVPNGAEVGLFPPVSGGSGPTVLMVTNDALDLDDLVTQITLPTTGAACLFTGMVRAVTTRDDPRETASLEYEAYESMAQVKLAQVADEIRERWPLVEGIVLVQRIGLLKAGTPTIVIGCTAAHRDTGVFDAARYGIDRIKEIVPVWKKEIGPNGETWIEGHYHPKKGD